MTVFMSIYITKSFPKGASSYMVFTSYFLLSYQKHHHLGDADLRTLTFLTIDGWVRTNIMYDNTTLDGPSFSLYPGSRSSKMGSGIAADNDTVMHDWAFVGL